MDDVLCDKLFADFTQTVHKKPVDTGNVAQVNGGFISVDTQSDAVVDPSVKKKKLTWYKADIEPSVGTSLFFEVPVGPQITAIAPPSKDTKLMLLRKRSKDRGARTLILKPGNEERLTKQKSRGLEEPVVEDSDSFGPNANLNGGFGLQKSSYAPYKRPKNQRVGASGVSTLGQLENEQADELSFLGLNSIQVALRSKVWHSTASIFPVPQLMVTQAGQLTSNTGGNVVQDPKLASKKEAEPKKMRIEGLSQAAKEPAKVMENGVPQPQMRPPTLTLTQQMHRSTAITETKIKVERLKSMDQSKVKNE